MIGGYRLSSIAESDVAAIVEHSAADNLEAAIRIVDRFTAMFELIGAQPNLGERCGDAPRVRRMSVGNYVVFYQTLGDEVVVIRVLHGARQWEKLI